MNSLADILMIIHLLWVIFMIVGLPLGIVLRSPLIRWGHLAGIAVTGFFAASGMYCPLTTWEEALRWHADPSFTYRGSFLAEILAPILYPRIDPGIIRGVSIAWGVVAATAMMGVKRGRGFRRRQGQGAA